MSSLQFTIIERFRQPSTSPDRIALIDEVVVYQDHRRRRWTCVVAAEELDRLSQPERASFIEKRIQKEMEEREKAIQGE